MEMSSLDVVWRRITIISSAQSSDPSQWQMHAANSCVLCNVGSQATGPSINLLKTNWLQNNIQTILTRSFELIQYATLYVKNTFEQHTWKLPLETFKQCHSKRIDSVFKKRTWNWNIQLWTPKMEDVQLVRQ